MDTGECSIIYEPTSKYHTRISVQNENNNNNNNNIAR